ncbi:MAG: Fe-S cluster assembly protein SufD [Pelagibacteraceae bacterium]|nr:Fe-S cluster assembly protein SufD [Pelagibacteraceae bacterium]PPR51586.1 MAG: FeS cluster assembly protein SufD [Alphaproteobacteria bacterium MarineAlpha5_Bin10]|tara:strand:+ start:1971 stop:3212 length:1242 start_codon:yes stop_codon:yes gene_type:complete
MPEIEKLYNQNKKHLIGSEIPWLKEMRNNILKELESTGIPSKKKETWKYSDLKHVRNVKYVFDESGIKNERKDYFGDVNFINGKHISEIQEDHIKNIFIEKLESNIINFEKYFSINSNFLSQDFITDLNTIFLTDGLTLSVPNNVKTDLKITYSNNLNSISSYIRNIIKVGKNSEFQLIENFNKDNTEDNSSNVFNIFWLEEGAKVEHILIQNAQQSSKIAYSSLIFCYDNSDFEQFSFQCGSESVKNQHTTNLIGRRSSVKHYGVYFAKDAQFVDNKTTVIHHEQECKSNQIYKGVLSDESNGVYLSNTLVKPEAQKTEGYQLSRGMLLSEKSVLKTKPELKIYADDVKCSHGSTVGEIDREQLYYLQSRGINKKESEKLLIKAFTKDVLENMKNKESLNRIDEIIDDWLTE